MKTLAIIGGGAAGLACAVAAAEEAARLTRESRARGARSATENRGSKGPALAGGASELHAKRDGGARLADADGLRVVVYEADERVGRSILATGNGRCNFSNANIDPKLYHNARFVDEALMNLEVQELAGAGAGASRRRTRDFGENAVRTFFEKHGLMWREESEGRLYPLANKASVVLDILRSSAAAAGVEERTCACVAAVEPPREAGKRFTLRMADGAFERADAVVVAVGGAVARDFLPEGVAFRKTRPVLGPLATDVRYVRQLDNIRVRGALELRRANKTLAREEGEIMFRKYGVSGIAAFNLSRVARAGDALAVDFIPRIRLVDMVAFLNGRRKKLLATYGNALTCGDFLRGVVLPQVAHVLLDSLGLAEDAPYVRDYVEGLARALKEFPLEVTGIGDERQCQVHRGGVDVAGVDPRTCELRAVPGAYVVGEALDVDAPCGGYNLHWAWSSGLLAGYSAARTLLAEEAGEDE